MLNVYGWPTGWERKMARDYVASDLHGIFHVSLYGRYFLVTSQRLASARRVHQHFEIASFHVAANRIIPHAKLTSHGLSLSLSPTLWSFQNQCQLLR